MSEFIGVFTNAGLAALALQLAGKDRPWLHPDGLTLFNPVLTFFAFGDGNGAPITPSSSMTALVHEVGRVNTNITIDPSAPMTVRVQGTLGAFDGPFMVRELGIFSFTGDLVAVASCPDVYKPVPSDLPPGPGVTEIFRILLDLTPVTTAPPVTMEVAATDTASRKRVDDGDAGRLRAWMNWT